MANNEDYGEAETTALRVLAWVVCDEQLGPRLLALTGLDPAELRAHAGEAALLAGVLAFLEDHEPDLKACARALDLAPETLVRARTTLQKGVPAA